jgi:hypothetical protein
MFNIIEFDHQLYHNPLFDLFKISKKLYISIKNKHIYKKKKWKDEKEKI